MSGGEAIRRTTAVLRNGGQRASASLLGRSPLPSVLALAPRGSVAQHSTPADKGPTIIARRQ
jgi:hypothetical protein